MIEGFGEIANQTCINCMLDLAKANDLLITPYPEYYKLVILVFIVGFVIGIIAGEVFRWSYRYGKQHSPKQ